MSCNVKAPFTDRCRWQNFRPSLLRLVNNCVESIYKMQKTRTKVLPSATVGEQYFSSQESNNVFFCTALWHNSWVSQDVVVNGTHLYIRIWGFGEDLSTEGQASLPSFQSLKTDDINVPPCLDRITLGFRINFDIRLLHTYLHSNV